jgi:hypothetical protein
MCLDLTIGTQAVFSGYRFFSHKAEETHMPQSSGKKEYRGNNQPTNIAIAICTAIPIHAQVQAYIQLSYKHNQAMLYAIITSTASDRQINTIMNLQLHPHD